MNEKFSLLPTPEELAQFVTWPALEDALLGIKRDWENIQPQERVVVEISSQTDPVSTGFSFHSAFKRTISSIKVFHLLNNGNFAPRKLAVLDIKSSFCL
jgi:hypothetical protein